MYNSNTYTGDDEDDMTMFAFEALDKVASYVGGQLVVSSQSSNMQKRVLLSRLPATSCSLASSLHTPQVPIVMRLLGPMLVDSSWIKRRAALVCLAVVCEGCVQHLRPHLKEVRTAQPPHL